LFSLTNSPSACLPEFCDTYSPTIMFFFTLTGSFLFLLHSSVL
jgi:hypothetical protein